LKVTVSPALLLWAWSNLYFSTSYFNDSDEILNEIFYKSWIESYRYIQYMVSPFSLDFILLDFFYYIKNIVYRILFGNAENMKNWITDVCYSISWDILILTAKHFESWLRMEVYLNIILMAKNIDLRVEKIWSHKISIEILISTFTYFYLYIYMCARLHIF